MLLHNSSDKFYYATKWIFFELVSAPDGLALAPFYFFIFYSTEFVQFYINLAQFVCYRSVKILPPQPSYICNAELLFTKWWNGTDHDFWPLSTLVTNKWSVGSCPFIVGITKLLYHYSARAAVQCFYQPGNPYWWEFIKTVSGASNTGNLFSTPSAYMIYIFAALLKMNLEMHGLRSGSIPVCNKTTIMFMMVKTVFPLWLKNFLRFLFFILLCCCFSVYLLLANETTDIWVVVVVDIIVYAGEK